MSMWKVRVGLEVQRSMESFSNWVKIQQEAMKEADWAMTRASDKGK